MSMDAQTTQPARDRLPANRRQRTVRGARTGLLVALGCLVLLALAPAAQAAGTGAISGTVTHGPSPATPYEGVHVRVYQAPTRHVVRETVTGVGGKYEVAGLEEGEYKVEFAPPEGARYLSQYYDDAHTYAGAEVVEVEGGETESNINAELKEGGKIEGFVEDSEGEAEPYVFVEVFGEVEGEPVFTFTQTNGEGKYVVEGLAEGEYKLLFYPELGIDLVPQYYEGKSTLASAEPVYMNEEEVEKLNEVVLQVGGEISGTVTNAVTHEPVAGVRVEADNTGPSEFGNEGWTNENGEYTIVGLATGTYNLAFSLEEEEGLSQTYIQPSTDEGVHVAQPETTSGVNLALIPKAPNNTAAPVASGTPALGQTLSCSTGSWTGVTPLAYAYQWLRDGAAIAGASSSSYVVQGADQGHRLSCEVTASNSSGQAAARSNTLSVPAAVPLPPPSPSPPSPPPPALKPAISISSLEIVASGNSAHVRLSCKAAPCHGALELTEQIVVKHRKGKKTITRRQTIVLGTGTYSLAAGKSGTFVVHLTKAATSRLSHARHHRVSGALAVSLAGGKSVKGAVLVSMAVQKAKHK